jgi:putative aminopeptidase FrvX
MIKTIQDLSEFFNGSGSEHRLSEFLNKTLQAGGFDSYIDPAGSVVAKIEGRSAKKEKIMITCPLDVPCLLNLYCEKNNAFLAKIGSESFDPKVGDSVIGENGKTFKLKKSPYDEKSFFVSGKNLKLGDAFRQTCKIEENENAISGRYAARYTLMAILLELLKFPPKNDLILSFAAGFETNAKSEANIAFREKPDTILFLSAEETNKKEPAVVIKDGKCFSNEILVKKILKTNPKIRTTVHSPAISKAETVFFPSDAKIAILAIPAQSLAKDDERVSKTSIQRLQKILNGLI